MIVDTSALVAIAFDEPDGRAMFELILAAETVGVSAANIVEYSIVVHGRSSIKHGRLADRIPRDLGVHVVPVTATQAELATVAYRQYGRGSGHPARLNLGDCFAYALAIDQDEPLLWVGDDFGHTDVRAAR